MPNNTLWLVHRPTGNAVCFGRSMGGGWYLKNEILERVTEFFNACEAEGPYEGLDDFMVVAEEVRGLAPFVVTDDWTFAGDAGDGKPTPTSGTWADRWPSPVWQPASTAPKGQWVLGYAPSQGVCVCMTEDGDVWELDTPWNAPTPEYEGEAKMYYPPTHWMPLPEKPPA